MCQPATQKYQDLFTKPRTYLFGTPNLTYMRWSFNFSAIDGRDEEIEALKSEVAEIKMILSDGSDSESHSNGKFTIISVNKVKKLFLLKHDRITHYFETI